jgi:hypothetical protein
MNVPRTAVVFNLKISRSFLRRRFSPEIFDLDFGADVN